MEIRKIIIEHSTQEEHDIFIRNHPDAQLIIKDEDCLRIVVYFYIQFGRVSFSLVQMKMESDSLFNVSLSIEGGILLYDKNQIDLFETSKNNG